MDTLAVSILTPEHMTKGAILADDLILVDLNMEPIMPQKWLN